MVTASFTAKTDPGKQRSNNEDCFLCDEALGVWLVADGMGGHNCGEVASRIAADTIANGLKDNHSLTRAVNNAHERIRAQSNENVEQQGMGTTLVALHDLGDRYQICWVGDSRIYRWNPNDEPPFQQLSRDHSYVQELLDSGAINQQEADQHPQKNIITQSLGCPLDTIRIDSEILEWQDGDILLLCSDGLSDELNNEEIASLLEQPLPTEDLANDLIEASLARGGRDNITVVLVNRPPTSTTCACTSETQPTSINSIESNSTPESSQPAQLTINSLYSRNSGRLVLTILGLLLLLYLSVGNG